MFPGINCFRYHGIFQLTCLSEVFLYPKKIKIYLQNSFKKDRWSGLATLATKDRETEEINPDEVIDRFT